VFPLWSHGEQSGWIWVGGGTDGELENGAVEVLQRLHEIELQEK